MNVGHLKKNSSYDLFLSYFLEVKCESTVE